MDINQQCTNRMIFRQFIIFIVSLILAKQTFGDSSCNTNGKNTTPRRLKNDILCNYDTTMRPVTNHQNSMNVTVRMMLKYFTYDMHGNTITVHNWLGLHWKDEFLKWNPSDYDSIRSIHLNSDEIWMPDLSIYNRNNQAGNARIIDSVDCLVYSTGTVVCVPPTRQDALCQSDVSKYPFDVQNCTFRYGSWVHTGEEIDFILAAQAISVEDFVENGEWELVNVSASRNEGHYSCCPNSTYPSFSYNFLIKRRSALHTATVFIPALVMTIVTLTVMWIDPMTVDRLCLACCDVLSHLLYAQYLSWQIPVNGDKTPLIILFARDSLLISAFVLVLTVVLKNITKAKEVPPVWIATLSTAVAQKVFYNYYASGAKSLKNDEDSVTIVEQNLPESTAKEWFLLAKVLDRLSFIILLLIYTCMLIAFIP